VAVNYQIFELKPGKEGRDGMEGKLGVKSVDPNPWSELHKHSYGKLDKIRMDKFRKEGWYGGKV